METISQVIKDIDQNLKVNQKISLFVGFFKNFDNNNNYQIGSINLGLDIYNKILKDVDEISKKKNIYDQKLYNFRNMTLICSKNNKTIIKKTPYFNQNYEYFSLNIDDEEELSDEQFPIISSYHKISSQKIIDYYYGKKDSITISFIKENCNSQINRIKVNLNYDYDENEVRNILEIILKEIS